MVINSLNGTSIPLDSTGVFVDSSNCFSSSAVELSPSSSMELKPLNVGHSYGLKSSLRGIETIGIVCRSGVVENGRRGLCLISSAFSTRMRQRFSSLVSVAFWAPAPLWVCSIGANIWPVPFVELLSVGLVVTVPVPFFGPSLDSTSARCVIEVFEFVRDSFSVIWHPSSSSLIADKTDVFSFI